MKHSKGLCVKEGGIFEKEGEANSLIVEFEHNHKTFSIEYY
jgi:hypothetical protein